MGLLKRARSFQGASRSDRPASEGLLSRSLELIDRLLPQRREAARHVTQAEIDAPPAAAISDVLASAASIASEAAADKKSPETVPRTWKESGGTAPGQSPPEGEQLSEAERLKRLWAGLGELEEGLESPGRLFSLVKEQLRLQRAALLLYDPVRMVFAPWAVHGFDQTTNHRLRIPVRANATMNRLAAGKVHLLSSPEELQPFQQFFSFREFSTLSNLLLVPFIHESRFLGLLLSAEANGTGLDVFDTLAERAARHLYAARERHLEGAKRGTPEQPEFLPESVRTALQSCVQRGFPPLMIRIDTATLMESVRRQNPYIDSFRLNQDISRVVLSLFQHLGSVFQIDRERMLILVTNTSQPVQEGDCEMLLYHLKATLGRLLPELAEQERIDLDEQVRIPSSDIEEALTYLAEIV